MKEIQPPAREERDVTVFLAGSIEMGAAENWQKRILEHFADWPVTFYNPRRDDWNSEWEQVAVKGKPFYTQVEWEIDHIESADIVLLWFDASTKSPISLLELGLLCAKKPAQTLVYCPEGFWRKGNVDYMCQRYGIKVHKTWESMISDLQWRIHLK